MTSPRAWIIAPFSLTVSTYLRRSDRLSGRFDVAGELIDQLLLAAEDLLVAEPPPHFDDEPAAVEVALEVEQVRLDPAFLAAVMGVEADRDRGTMVERGAGVDPVRRDEQRRLDREVRRRVAERAAALVAGDDGAVQLGRPSEQPCGPLIRPGAAAADLVDETPSSTGAARTSYPEPFEQLEVAAALRPKRKSPPATTTPRRKLRGRELLRLEPGESSVNGTTVVSATPSSANSSSRRSRVESSLDEVAPDDARMRLKGQHPDRQARPERGLDDPPVAAWTRRTSRSRPRTASDRAHGSRASACSAGITRCSSASSTLNGPTSSRRSATQ